MANDGGGVGVLSELRAWAKDVGVPAVIALFVLWRMDLSIQALTLSINAQVVATSLVVMEVRELREIVQYGHALQPSGSPSVQPWQLPGVGVPPSTSGLSK